MAIDSDTAPGQPAYTAAKQGSLFRATTEPTENTKATTEGRAIVRYAHAYAEAITSVTGRPFTPPTDADYMFRMVLRTHAIDASGKPLRSDELIAWIRDTVPEFARNHDPTYGGYSVAALRKWLDGGRKPRRLASLQQPAEDGTESDWRSKSYTRDKADP
jgi:hypothetical protein